jgi:Protein of unknown function (DUF4058)
MNTPFPGMDPYLEHPALWPAVHARLIIWLAHQLIPLLRPRYVVSVEDRVFLEEGGQQRISDLWVQQVRNGGGRISVAGLEVASPVVIEVEELEVREHFIEILDRYQDLKVVTVIEVVSPSNKKPGPGRKAYLAKQAEVLGAECHLVELDLLRRGRHVLRIPKRRARAAAPYEYLIRTNRWPKRNRYELVGCRLRERLPRIGVPLTEPDPDAALDLQAALEQAYDDGSYMLRVRYDRPCDPPLNDADQQWANEQWAAYHAAHPELFPPAAT